nr:MAG TPA: hypothetical protein [Caudoviricetes sp.]
MTYLKIKARRHNLPGFLFLSGFRVHPKERVEIFMYICT